MPDETPLSRLGRIEDLQLFKQIVDSGSLSAAARALGLGKNAVSRRLAELERRMGVVLLSRTTRSLSPTPEGLAVYDGAAAILREVSALEGRLGRERPLSGQLRLLVPTLTLEVDLLVSLRRALEASPELRVHVDVADEAVDPVRGGYDAVLCVGPPPTSTPIARRLGTLTPVLATSEHYARRCGLPETPEALAEHECLLWIARTRQRTWTLIDEAGNEVTVPVGGRFESRDSRVLHRALVAGLGVGIRPSYELLPGSRTDSLGEVLVRVLPGHTLPAMPLSVLSPRGVHQLPRVRMLVDLLEQIFSRLG